MDQLPARETIPALIRRSVSPPRDAVLSERVAGAWIPTSSETLLDRVCNAASAIRGAGLQRGDRVALIAADCVDWIVADFAIVFAGCVVVPIFPTQAPDHIAFILADSDAKLVFVDTAAALERLQAHGVAPPPAVFFEGNGENSLAAFELCGARIRRERSDWPAAFEAEATPDELAVLIYTSGTTGEPKGVMLSHYNLVFTAQATVGGALGVITPGSNVLSVLPFSHIYEHCFIYAYLIAHARHHIAHDVGELLSDLRDVRPVFMTAVPRIFERMLAGIVAKSKQHGGLQAAIVPWALETGRDYMTAVNAGERPGFALALRYRIASALVLSKIRPRLGLDRLGFMASGSAPLHIDTAMTMRAAGIEIVEGYGPTECSPVITVNRYDDNEYGTVGKPIPGVQIRLAEDGEILAKGPNVMLGYYRNPQATAEVMSDGWYHTGDVGTLDERGFLRITDRKKELFKTSGGKFVAPSRVEAAIKRSVYVSQVMLVGDSRPHPAALVAPNWELVRAELRISPQTPTSELIARPEVVAFLTKEVRENTADLAAFEQVRRIAILPNELTIEAGELSPSLKIKRRVVEAKYSSLVDAIYAS